MPKEQVIEVLRRHPFVEEFQPEHIERLTQLAKQVHFDRDQVIFHEGDECHDFYLIVKGRVAVEIEAPDHTLRVQTLTAGDELGWSAILMGRGKFFQGRALEPVDALAFDGAATARRLPRGQGVRLRVHVPDAGRRVRAPAGHAAAAPRHVFAGREAGRHLNRRSPGGGEAPSAGAQREPAPRCGA